MMLALGIMFGGAALSWAALRSSSKRGSALKDSLARVDVQTLAGCVLVLSGLMPAVSYGRLASPVGPPRVAVFVLALEAVVCLSMDLARNRERSRAVQNWMAATLARTIGGAL